MIVTILKTTRRNEETPFFPRQQEIIELVNQLKAEGKFLAESGTMSEDKLTQTYQSIWASKEDYVNFLSLPEIREFSKQRAQYNLDNEFATEFQILNYED